MTNLFGRYESQSTMALRSIDSSKYPDTNKDFERNIQRLNEFVDYIAQYLGTMQKGIDQASADPITRIRDFITDIGVLLGGGELLYGVDFGDLQYFLPALGALFGFDADVPFPLNLFYAAEHFLLGYVVPLDSFTSVIEDLILGWARALGLSDAFMAAVEHLLDNTGRFFNDLLDIFNNVVSLFGFLNIFTDAAGGPFASIWNIVTQLLSVFTFENLGHIIDPFLEVLTPWIEALAVILGYIDDLLEIFTEGTDGLGNIGNFISDLLGIFGLGPDSGLGTGNVDIPSEIENIPIFGPIIAIIESILGEVPIVGPLLNSLINLFINFLSGGALGEGDVGTLGDLLGNIPLIGDLIKMFTGQSTGSSGPLGFLGDIIGNLLKMIGLPDLGGLLTGGIFDLFDSIGKLLQNLFGGGAIGNENPVPPNLLSAIAPGASSNLLPDTFGNMNAVAGQGRWVWQQTGCVRTVRTGMTTVFFITGTHVGLGATEDTIDLQMEILPLLSNADYTAGHIPPDATLPTWGLDRAIDLDNLEFVQVPYPGTMTDIDNSIAVGKLNLVKAIKQCTPPGSKFILLGLSQGSSVVSEVYNEIRYGTMQDRHDDLLAGVCWGNPMREEGAVWTDPDYGTIADPAPGEAGIAITRLENTEPLWWDMAVPDDPISCTPLEGDTGYWARRFYSMLETPNLGVFDAVFAVTSAPEGHRGGLETLFELLKFGADQPYGGHAGYSTYKPFEAQNDDRNLLQIGVDYINSFGEAIEAGERHLFEGAWFPTTYGEVITASAEVMWHNLPTITGQAIAVGLNLYDADKNLVVQLASDNTKIVDPASSSEWEYVPLSEEFVVPEDVAWARLAFDVEPEAMTTGIVWFRKPVFQNSAQLDAAQLSNIENIVQIGGGSVYGPQGIINLEDAFQHFLDGLASANSDSTEHDVTFSQLFELQQQTYQKATQALTLALALQEQASYQVPVETSYSTAGTYTYNIPSFIEVGDTIVIGVLGGGGAGGGIPGILSIGTDLWGQGGKNASWATGTLTYGTQIPEGTTTLTVVVGAGGDSNGQAAGSSGGDSIVKLPNNTVLLASTGGQYGGPWQSYNGSNSNTTSNGIGPGNYDYAGRTFFGGSTVVAPNAASAPGGGGPGALPDNYANSKPGAAGMVTLIASKVA